MQNHIIKLYNLLFGYIKKRVNNSEDAEDLTQEVFLKLSKTDIDSIKNISNWVYTIAKNSITDYYRKKKVIVEELNDYSIENNSDNGKAIKEMSSCVMTFIQQLPEDYQEIMILSEIEEIPQKEIAQQLQLNYVTVRSKIQRGRKKMKALFTQCCSIDQGTRGSILGYEYLNKDKNCGCSENTEKQ